MNKDLIHLYLDTFPIYKQSVQPWYSDTIETPLREDFMKGGYLE